MPRARLHLTHQFPIPRIWKPSYAMCHKQLIFARNCNNVHIIVDCLPKPNAFRIVGLLWQIVSGSLRHIHQTWQYGLYNICPHKAHTQCDPVSQHTCYATMLHEEVTMHPLLATDGTFWDSTATFHLLYQQIGVSSK